jgi:DNA recombination protein RmuC
VLFLPAESFFSAALEQDRTLIEDAMEKRVILASPTTLLALLRTVAHGWRQEKLAENAAKISAEGKTLYERVTKFLAFFEDIRSGLDKATKAYNNAVSSYTARLRPQGERLQRLGIETADQMPEIEPINVAPLPIPVAEAEELTPSLFSEPPDSPPREETEQAKSAAS